MTGAPYNSTMLLANTTNTVYRYKRPTIQRMLIRDEEQYEVAIEKMVGTHSQRIAVCQCLNGHVTSGVLTFLDSPCNMLAQVFWDPNVFGQRWGMLMCFVLPWNFLCWSSVGFARWCYFLGTSKPRKFPDADVTWTLRWLESPAEHFEGAGVLMHSLQFDKTTSP